jgi:arginyl-tRNA synthetase
LCYNSAIEFKRERYLSGILALRHKIIGLLTEAAAKAQAAGKLPAVTLPDVALEHPQKPEHGDYASSLPLKLARATRLKPLDIAGVIRKFIPADPAIVSVTVAPPGFINFTLDSDWLSRQVEEVLASAETFGNVDLGKGRRVQIEFVSVNPTGPLHVGHGRGAILGSALANILSAAGFAVETEYYINNAGSQIEAFKHSLYTRYQQALGVDAELPANGYFGGYMADLAQAIIAEDGDKYSRLPEVEAIDRLGEVGLKKMIGQIKTDLERLGVTFDTWFSERSLFKNGQYDTAMTLLKEGGYIAEKETATWFVSTALGENKDNVVVRSDGSPTYFATDIAYHYNKFVERKFDQVINIWGADHQGHVSRMKAVVGAMGIDPERLKVIISQMVTLRRGGELVRISKRSGDIITLSEVVDEVGADVSRFFFLARSADSQMDFDMELAKKESGENPVYYVQYAHARIASILTLAAERKIDYADGDVSLLTSEPEQSLIRKMLLLPEVVEMAAKSLGPHQLAYYAQELATVFHSFYKQCRVISRDDAGLSKARLKLVVAAKIALSRCLHLMGMTAPDTM